MSIRHILTVLALPIVAAACSQKLEERLNATPTGPSVAVPGEPGGGVSRPAVVDFPPRPEALDFRMQLETKYASMGRRPAQTFVDMEGEATWIGEYDRYRVNGCDHDTATQRALAQIDGAAAGQVCAIRFFPETAIYPPRDQVVDFRRQLGSKYQAMGRSAQSAVDQEGAAIWIAEYLRYRTSGCDHPTAVQKTLTQVDGNPAPPTCLVQCAYRVSTPVSPPAAGGTFVAEMVRTSGSCDWLADSETPWITLSRPITGSDRGTLTYNVAANTAGPRSGTIRFNYPGGAAFLEVNQGSTSVTIGFQLFDPATSTSPTTECRIRANQTICTVTAVSAVLPAPIATYDWRVEYAYGGSKVRTQVGASSSFSFSESCGASAPDGSVIPLSVRLTATDTAGNSATVFSAQGAQPALQLRTFNCQ
jgi:hypothetical protein